MKWPKFSTFQMVQPSHFSCALQKKLFHFRQNTGSARSLVIQHWPLMAQERSLVPDGMVQPKILLVET